MSSVFLYFVICLLSLFSGFENAHVLEGRLPDTLAGLPLPARTQVAVSCIYRDNDVDFSAGVALDTPLFPEAFMAQMEQGLRQGGWEQVRIPPPSIESLVFVSTDLPTPATELAATPFFTKRGLTLTLEYPKARPGLPTRAFFRAERGGVPPEALPPSEPEGLLNDLLPLLTAPKGAELRSRFAVIGRDYVSGRANVTTRLSPNRLAEHFASHLSSRPGGGASPSCALQKGPVRARRARAQRGEADVRRAAQGLSFGRKPIQRSSFRSPPSPERLM